MKKKYIYIFYQKKPNIKILVLRYKKNNMEILK